MAERLAFGQYFTDTSNCWNGRGVAKYDVKWLHKDYIHFRLLGCLFPHIHESYYSIVVDEKEKRFQIHIQKTSNDDIKGLHAFFQHLTDWESNFMFVSKLYDEFEWEGNKIKLFVPKGWKMRWQAIEHEIRNAVSKHINEHEDWRDWRYECIGWSQGSSGAVLAAQQLNYFFGIKSYLYTYGSVRTFRSFIKKNRNIIKDYFNSFLLEVYNFRDINDIVGYMPPFPWNFTINPCEVSLEEDKKVKFKRLIDPMKYHTSYDLENYKDYE